MTELKPTGVSADRTKRLLTITWADGTTSQIPFDGLRVACPCVECKGGHANMGKSTPRQTVQTAIETNLQMTGLNKVGNYALQPTWSDGHTTGLYSWALLKAIG